MQATTKTGYPPIGIGVCVLSRDGKILMGKRKDNGLYAFPGGHLERYESWQECGRRELLEETNIDIPEDSLKVLVVNNIQSPKDKYHYVTIILVCACQDDQEIKNLEPEKCEGWEWWTMDDIQARSFEVFYTIRVLLQQKNECFNLNHLSKLTQQETKTVKV